MDIKETLKSIREDNTFSIGLLDILLLIAPGIAVIFVYQNSLFISLDWLKLILLSITITAPLVLLNTVLVPEFNDDGALKSNDLFGALTLSIWCTGILIFGTLVILYLFRQPFRNGAIFISVVEVALLIIASLRDRWKNRKLKRDHS